MDGQSTSVFSLSASSFARFGGAEFQPTNLHFVFQIIGRIFKCGFEIFRKAVETSYRAPASMGSLQCSSYASIFIPEICQIAEKM